MKPQRAFQIRCEFCEYYADARKGRALCKHLGKKVTWSNYCSFYTNPDDGATPRTL